LYNSILTFRRLFTPAALSVALMLDIWSLFVNKKHIHVIRIAPKASNHVLIIEIMLRTHSQLKNQRIGIIKNIFFWIAFFSHGRIYSLTLFGKLNGFGSHWIGSVLRAIDPLLEAAI
jgi:hypothetical protein